MPFIKKYWVWLALSAVMLVLLGIQVFWVGGIETAAREENGPAISALSSVVRTSRSTDGVPTRADLEEAEKHLDAIREMGGKVRERWREETGGLNRFMSGGERPDGTILHPEKNEPIRPELFAYEIRRLYAATLKKMRAALAEKMLPNLTQMYADEVFAKDRLATREEALEDGRKLAEERIGFLANVTKDDDLIPVHEDALFDRKPVHEMWREWRRYLIASDILERVVPKTEAKIERMLDVAKPVDPAERTGRAPTTDLPRDDYAESADKNAAVPVETMPVKVDAWRYIERVDDLVIKGPQPGNAALPGQPKPAEEGKPAVAPTGEVPPAGQQATYYDTYELTIRLTAHPKAIQQFMVEMMRPGSNIWYVEKSINVSPLSLDQTMGDFEAASKTHWQTLKGVGGVEGVSAPLQTVAGFGHESPVTVTLVYDIYRFRYTDTDNPPALAPAATTGTAGGVNGFGGFGGQIGN